MNELIEEAREAALTRPDDAQAHARLGRACLDAGRLAEAIEALQRAVRLDPENAAIRTALGRAWLAAADPEKAVFHLRRAVALEPGGMEAREALARAESAEPELSPDFVRALFDPYAAKFDSEMAALGYRAPEALRALYTRVAGEPRQDRDVLDLGCGTGLAGLAFRPFARTLIGVDLSPRMAEKARARGIYDRVVVGDMTRAMRDAPAAFDLILAADALGYVGDLAPLFRALRESLRSSGHFAASVEENQDRDKDFALGPARRFRHGEAYVRRAAQAAGLTILLLERCELRRDRGEPVAGIVFILGVSPSGEGGRRDDTIPAMRYRKIRDIIARQQLLTVRPDETVREAARRMVERNVAAALVADADGRLLGIFTERDMLRRVVAEGRDPDRTEIAKAMTAKPHVVSPDATGLEAVRVMQERHVRHLPVAAGGRALGIVSIRDFLGVEVDEVRREQESRERLWEA